MRYWSPEDVTEVDCGECGRTLEFFKTDGSRRCPGCGARVVNPAVSLGCAQWCDHARECLGFAPPELGEKGVGVESVVDQLIRAVREEFGNDQERISHALRVLDHAEEILREEGGDPAVVVAGALLHDIGIQKAERKYGDDAARHHEDEGPAIARHILLEADFQPDDVERVCRIVGSHHSGDEIDSREFRIVWDADWLVNFPSEYPDAERNEREQLIQRTFRTDAGQRKARERFLGTDSRTASE
jgi:putative nucleotidyltransferase with HDIG domain